MLPASDMTLSMAYSKQPSLSSKAVIQQGTWSCPRKRQCLNLHVSQWKLGANDLKRASMRQYSVVFQWCVCVCERERERLDVKTERGRGGGEGGRETRRQNSEGGGGGGGLQFGRKREIGLQN